MSSRKLNQASRLAVDELCEAAKDWGLEAEQGCRKEAVLASEKKFKDAKAAMEKRLRYLESQLAKHRHLAIMWGDTP